MNHKWFFSVFFDSKTTKQTTGVDRPLFDPFDILMNKWTMMEKPVPQPNIYHSQMTDLRQKATSGIVTYS